MIPGDLFLDLNGLRLHLNDWGGEASAQPILLVHGLASNAKIWNYVAPELAKTFRIAALDQRSHGLSSAPDDPDYSFEAICLDIHEICAGLKFTKPIIVGHSWGGSVALEYAARYPDAVAGAIMIDGGFAGLGQRQTWEETQQRLAPPRLAGISLAEFRERVRSGLGEHFNPQVFDIILGNFEMRPDQTLYPHLAFENHMQIVRRVWEQEPETLYPQVKCPALFLPCLPPGASEAVAAQSLQWKRESAERIPQLMPQAQIEWLIDSIHDVPLQRPALIVEKVRRFAEHAR